MRTFLALGLLGVTLALPGRALPCVETPGVRCLRPGDLDPTFGLGGDGRIVVAGSVGSQGTFGVARLLGRPCAYTLATGTLACD